MSEWPLWWRALMFGIFWQALYVALRYGLRVWYQERRMGTYTDLNQKGKQ